MIQNNHLKTRISLTCLRKNVITILKKLKLQGCEVDITLCSDAFMALQNKKHMGKTGPTDVLSFPAHTVPKKQIGNPCLFANTHLGDILVSLDTARQQAQTQGISLQKEVLFLIVHSLLHLMGFDHKTKTEQHRMQKLESQIWLSLYKPKNKKRPVHQK